VDSRNGDRGLDATVRTLMHKIMAHVPVREKSSMRPPGMRACRPVPAIVASDRPVQALRKLFKSSQSAVTRLIYWAIYRAIYRENQMILLFSKGLFELGLVATGAFLFLSLLLATEVGYHLGRLKRPERPAQGRDLSAVSTLTAGMIGLLTFTLSLSINFAQNRYETRRGLVLAEANAIGTAWLRTKLIDGDQGPAIATKIEAYARARLDFTSAASDADAPALIARTNALQADIWQTMRVVALRSPNTVTTTLINALNEMFDDSLAQQFAYASRVPAGIMMGLYFGALLSIGALGYQFGLIGQRYVVLSSLLLLMWSGGMLLIVELNLPRAGNIKPDVAPLVWTIQEFGAK
jgi:hypothetical protein